MMKYLYLIFLFFSYQGFAIQTNVLPKNLEVKLNKVIKEQFSNAIIIKEILVFTSDISKAANFYFKSDEIFKLKDTSGKLLGYAYLGKAKSKVTFYDYVVFFDNNLTISNIKILIYREDHGAEITSKRWLKQFLGLEKNQSILYKKDIAGISGATISAVSLTFAVNSVLKSVGTLHQLKQL